MSQSVGEDVSRGEASLPMGRLFRRACAQWQRLLGGLIFLAIGSGASLWFPQLARELLDASLASGDASEVDRTAWLLASVLLVQGIAGALRYLLFTDAGERIVARLRKDLFRTVIAQDIAFFDARSVGELMSRLSNDATVIQNTLSVNISQGIRNLVMAAGGVVLLFLTSPSLALWMLAVVPPVVLGAIALGRLLGRLSFRAQDQLARASSQAEESLSGVRTVRAFAQEAQASRRYNAAVDGWYVLVRSQLRWTALFTGAAGSAGFLALAFVVWRGGRMVLEGSLSAGDLMQFLLYTLLVAFAVGMLGALWGDLMRARGAALRIFELLDREPEIPLEGGMTLASVRGEVAFEGVRFAYPSRPESLVLRSLSFHVRAGEVVAFVGESGAGKSTIASLLRRFHDPLAGRVLFDGVDVRDLDPSWLRRQIGAVDQEPLLLSASIAENIRYGAPDASDEAVREAARRANALGFIEQFPEGFATQVGERGVQLSGGQKQRIAIARAFLKDPALLIFDEATSALDAESEYQVQQALDELMKGRTVIVIAHRLSTVAGVDRIHVLASGAVVESGAFAALVRSGGVFAQLVERQRLDEAPRDRRGAGPTTG